MVVFFSFLRLFVSYHPLTACTRASETGKGSCRAKAAPGNQVELSLPSRQITAAESAYNPANKSTTKGTTGGRGDGLSGGGGFKAGRNVIKSMRPQKPQRCGALGSSSKFSGLDRCSTISRGVCSRSVPRKLHSHKRSKKSCMDLVELFPETFMSSFLHPLYCLLDGK